MAQVDQLWTAAEGAEASWACLRYDPFDGRAAMAGQVAGLAARADQPF